MYSVTATAEAQKFYEDADRALQSRLDRCFSVLRDTPRRHPNIKPLKGRLTGCFRFRIGDYRVVYRVDDAIKRVTISTIANRRDVYE